MADALRIRTRIVGKTLTLSDLDRFIGKQVEVIVLEDEAAEETGAAPKKKPRFGSMAGKLHISGDFDAPLPDDLQRAFEGEDEL